MRLIYFLTHPDVIIDPAVPVPRWPLSERGRTRMTHLLTEAWPGDLSAIYCSTEQKALDGAQILAAHLDIGYQAVAELGEIDRSATGYLPHDEHAATARRLFLEPNIRVRGWESAVAAQARIVAAVTRITEQERSTGHTLIVSHGAVATLLLCHLKQVPISLDEAPPHPNGGCYFAFDASSNKLIHDWACIKD